MAERILVQGNDAVGLGALAANCEAFFGYPITPQNEVTEWFAREFPTRGKVFAQTASEVASINWLFGAAATGTRAMTSTSSPGWGLMQEGVSHLANGELPCVIVLIQRGGPGAGTTRHSQMDYLSVTRGGGQGGYKTITLAPCSIQETHDFMQLAFHLADKYRNPVVLLSDGIIGQMMEFLELRTIDYGILPDKDWAVRGKINHKDGRRRIRHSAQGFVGSLEYPTYLSFLQALDSKYHEIETSEIRYETYLIDDADLIVVAFGYVARVSRDAVDMARAKGLKVGLIRPITLWPFPYHVIEANRNAKFLVVEDNLGQMIDDVRMALGRKTDIQLVGALDRHDAGEGGAIFTDKVLEKIESLL
ncbi:MAG: 3-methyl-2-oxobutanoate dehydrogenase subunit VorB [Chloroflexota bacterium]|nr:3-methyl-2-oxobutanoate dehydrogenase subunit VorB [Chloroflexota bacterium]